MNRTIPALVLLAAATAAGGCIPNNFSIEILRARPVEDDCSVVPGDLAISQGFFDVSFAEPRPSAGFTGTDYFQGFHIRNNMPANDEATDFRLDSANFVTERAIVSYDGGDFDTGGVLRSLGERETLFSVTVEAAGGEHGVFVNLIPRSVAQAIATSVVTSSSESATILVSFFIRGHTLDGAALDSGVFSFPVQVCNGCLAEFCPDRDGDGNRDAPFFKCAPGHRPLDCEEFTD